MNETPKEWCTRVFGEQAAEDIPVDMTWNDFFVAQKRSDGQQPPLNKQTQERCLWRLAEILHTPVEKLRAEIGKENT